MLRDCHLSSLAVAAAVLLCAWLPSERGVWAEQSMSDPWVEVKDEGGAEIQKPAPSSGDAHTGSTNLWKRTNLLDDMGGLRTFLGDYGISVGLSEISEVLGNMTGGTRRGAAYDGLATMDLTLDTEKAFHWEGGTFHASALQIHGRNLSADNLDNLQTVSGIEANRSTRLWELWFQQKFSDGKVDLRIGQESIDQEFIFSQYAGLYMNTMMGWPMVPSADLYAGGPAYPLSSLGVRLRVRPDESLTLLGGVFDDNPPGGPFNNDLQTRDGETTGTRFNLGTGALLIGELQYAVGRSRSEQGVRRGFACGLPGTWKLGGWYDTAKFPDQRFNTYGLPAPNPAAGGAGRMLRGNFSLYGVVDQMVWREAGGPQSVGLFLRVMGAPADRNLIDWSLNAGVNLKALIPGREDDTFGIGYGWAHVSRYVGDLVGDTGSPAIEARPDLGSEHFVEVTYQYQLAPWCIVQPDVQYIINPGGGIPNPSSPTELIDNELVLGLRITVTF
jgi:porin